MASLKTHVLKAESQSRPAANGAVSRTCGRAFGFHEQIQGARELQVLANLSQEREMLFLQSQIKPHFLYNTLNAVISYSYVDEQKAKQMLQHLMDYMNYIFRNESFDTMIPLAAEIGLIESFVQISSLRMGRPIQVIFDVPKEFYNVNVMPFLIQPIVENAIIHGIAKRKEAGTVIVKIENHRQGMQITIEDDGAGLIESDVQRLMKIESDASTGIGIANLKARLMNKTGKSLLIESKPDQYTKVQFVFPIF